MKLRTLKKSLKQYALTFCRTVYEDGQEVLKKEVYPSRMHFSKWPGPFIDGIVPNEQGPHMAQIEIYGIIERPIEDMKMTIRHECLHFILRENGLPWDDYDNIFLIFAFCYGAVPYGLFLTKEERNKTIDPQTSQEERGNILRATKSRIDDFISALENESTERNTGT